MSRRKVDDLLESSDIADEGQENYCPRCGDPLSRDPEIERKAREAGMCALCVEAVKASN